MDSRKVLDRFSDINANNEALYGYNTTFEIQDTSQIAIAPPLLAVHPLISHGDDWNCKNSFRTLEIVLVSLSVVEVIVLV